MATLNARLSALETIASPKLPRLLLFLVRHAGAQSGSHDTITGIRADGEHTNALQRQQGETVKELTDRARATIKGSGVLLVQYEHDPAGFRTL